jgi:hypothetical protein
MRGEERKRGWGRIERQISAFLQKRNDSLFDKLSFCELTTPYEPHSQTNVTSLV